jgi:hypothetical protein
LAEAFRLWEKGEVVKGRTPGSAGALRPGESNVQASLLPWQIVERRRGGTRIIDANCRTVLHCPRECTRQDRANLELIVASVNACSPNPGAAASSQASGIPEVTVPAFTIHEAERDVVVDPLARGASPKGGA